MSNEIYCKKLKAIIPDAMVDNELPCNFYEEWNE